MSPSTASFDGLGSERDFASEDSQVGRDPDAQTTRCLEAQSDGEWGIPGKRYSDVGLKKKLRLHRRISDGGYSALRPQTGTPIDVRRIRLKAPAIFPRAQKRT